MKTSDLGNRLAALITEVTGDLTVYDKKENGFSSTITREALVKIPKKKQVVLFETAFGHIQASLNLKQKHEKANR